MNSRYSLIPSLSEKQMNYFSSNLAIKDTSNNLLERNMFMMNSKGFDKSKENFSKIRTVFESNKERNNYLDPISSFQIREIAPKNNLNKETLNLMRLKYYSCDIAPMQGSIKQGIFKSFCEYKKDKDNCNNNNGKINSNKNLTIDTSSLPKINKENILIQNIVCFDKNSKGEIVKRPKGFWDFSHKIKEFNRESKDAPDLFQILSEERAKKHEQDLINKEETITLLSRNKSWITVTPTSKNRRNALENIKVKNNNPTQIIPQWMRSKFNQKLEPDIMKGVNDTSVRTRKRTMQLVDINNLSNNPSNRSIFSIGDYRHNLAFKHECEENQLNISNEPKKFFDWDDKRDYDNKKKRDYI